MSRPPSWSLISSSVRSPLTLSSAANKFTDVAANRWSAGYVDYCATTGVVAGVGNGQFNPTGSLTALQFGKMLLVCLGYDATTENLTGADWQINTSKLMASAKLLKGLDDVKANDVITREQGAQMMLNAIKAPTVEYDTKGSTITIGGTVIGIAAPRPLMSLLPSPRIRA